MSDETEVQASLEAVLKDEIVRMYQEVADNPTGTFHFFHGLEAAELFGYAPDWLERAPASAVASFAGVGNPHERSDIQPGETVLDRLHQAMILFAASRTAALKRFLVDDGHGRDQRFWRLAQALSALYPANTDEKRWVDGVLARKKGLGF